MSNYTASNTNIYANKKDTTMESIVSLCYHSVWEYFSMSSVAVVSEELSLLTPLFGLELDSRFGLELDSWFGFELDSWVGLELDCQHYYSF